MSTQTTTHPSWIQSFALKVLGLAENFWALWSPSLKQETQTLLTQLAPIAIAAVTSLATSGKSGTDKQSAAFATIKADATAAGIAAGTSAINAALELAVLQLPTQAVSTATDTAVATPQS